ncbi:MAG: hypothetical protein NT093_02320 [Candidatus Moranbacteria bacterium]|nr:hypothetical protein [Candidatus Moranbacteria bacterium]
MLLLFLSMIPTSIFLDKIIQKIVNTIEKHRKKFIIGAILAFIIIIVFKKIIMIIELRILLMTIPVYKDISFYRGTVEMLYYIFIFSVLTFIAMLIISAMREEKKWPSYLINMLVILMIFVPFFATNVGKIPLKKTFAYIGKNTQFKLESTLYEGDIFKVYFQAKNILPKKSLLAVDYSELYAYDDYFSLRYFAGSSDINYQISENCEEKNWKILASSNKVYLCGRR